MPSLTLLGVSSADPRPGTDPTSFVVRGDEGALLVDCGGCVLPRLMEAGLEPEEVRALFLTHTHPDHLGGFPLFIHGLAMLGRTRPLEVAGHEEALETARALLATLGIAEEPEYPIHWRTLPADRPGGIEFPGFRLATFVGRHSRPVLGASLQTGGRRLTFSGDTGPCDALRQAAGGADLLVQELGKEDERDYPYHCGPSDVAELAVDARPKRIVLVHTQLAGWPEREAALAVIRKAYDGLVDFGEPLRVYDF